MSEQNSTLNTSCDEYRKIYIYTSVPVVTFVLIILSFLTTRKSTICARFSRPGLLVPVNLLDQNKNIIYYAAAFGCTVHDILNQILSLENNTVESWTLPFIILLFALVIGTIYYPLFACLHFENKSLAAPAIGTLYASYLFSTNIVNIKECEERTWMSIASYFPVLLCQFFLILAFLYKLIRRVVSRLKHEEIVEESLAKEHHRQYVKLLLSKKGLGPEQTDTLQSALQSMRMCYGERVLYRCTIRTVAVYSVALLLLYLWFLRSVGTEVLIRNAVKSLKNVTKDLINSENDTQVFVQIDLLADVTEVSFILAVVLSAIIIILNMVQIYYSCRKHFLQLCQGDKTFIPKQCRRSNDKQSMISFNIMYAGTQIGHFIYSYIINLGLIWLLCMLVAYFVVLPLAGKVPMAFFNPVQVLLPGLLVMYAVIFILSQISKVAFLQNHLIKDENTGEEEKKRVLALDNRNVYHVFTYFLFFFFIIFGVLRSLSRMLKSSLLSFINLARLDRSIMIPGFEHWDQGYMSYIGFLQMEEAHCHPVLVVFCDLLLKRQKIKGRDYGSTVQLNSTTNANMYQNYRYPSASSSYTSARSKWHKLYTLLRNPNLCAVTKSALILDKLESKDPSIASFKRTSAKPRPKKSLKNSIKECFSKCSLFKNRNDDGRGLHNDESDEETNSLLCH